MTQVSKLPEINIAALLVDSASAASRAVASELTAACHDPGFCYLSGHGIPAELEQRVMDHSREFFGLAESVKRELAITNSPHFRGYTRLGGELTRGVRDWREQLDVGLEESYQPLGTDDRLWSKLRGPNQWPRELPALSVAVLEWMDRMQQVALAVLRALAVGLGQGVYDFDRFMLPRGDPHLKIIRYPAQAPGKDTGQGVGLHHDSGLLSFVMQDSVGGLQVRIGDELVEVEPTPNSYVMNLGEMMQAATNGYLRATKHRVRSPPPGQERIAVAYFANPKLESVLEPVRLPDELARVAPGWESVDPNDPIFSRFGDNYLKIRLRAHPDVAEKHYADLR